MAKNSNKIAKNCLKITKRSEKCKNEKKKLVLFHQKNCDYR